MTKGLSYLYHGTKGDIIAVASCLPPKGEELLDQGWIDISHVNQSAHGHYTYKEITSGLQVKYDEGKPGANGFSGKGHYHIMNPNASNNGNLYLNKDGEPVRKNSKQSHILPQNKKE